MNNSQKYNLIKIASMAPIIGGLGGAATAGLGNYFLGDDFVIDQNGKKRKKTMGEKLQEAALYGLGGGALGTGLGMGYKYLTGNKEVKGPGPNEVSTKVQQAANAKNPDPTKEGLRAAVAGEDMYLAERGIDNTLNLNKGNITMPTTGGNSDAYNQMIDSKNAEEVVSKAMADIKAREANKGAINVTLPTTGNSKLTEGSNAYDKMVADRNTEETNAQQLEADNAQVDESVAQDKSRSLAEEIKKLTEETNAQQLEADNAQVSDAVAQDRSRSFLANMPAEHIKSKDPKSKANPYGKGSSLKDMLTDSIDV